MKPTSLFIDEATITVEAGDGGNGCASLRRAKFEPKGGPDGGDGGRGGDIILVADRNVSTLLELRSKQKVRAAHGADGQNSDRTGRSGTAVEVRLPVGTTVYNLDAGDDSPITDLVSDGQRFIAARGGRGGRGNIHFATPSHQAPKTAEEGRPGQHRKLRLSLKLIADAGLVGLPNAGKSTLLRTLSAARPKVAAYPFTTLIPCLGVVRFEDRDFVLADIPGLIEGASDGLGLGDQFLRHVERTRVLVHVLDVGQLTLEGRDPVGDYETIRGELEHYDPAILERHELIVLTKLDLLANPDEELAAIEKFFQNQGREVFRVSSVAKRGMRELCAGILRALDAARVEEEAPMESERQGNQP